MRVFLALLAERTRWKKFIVHPDTAPPKGVEGEIIAGFSERDGEGVVIVMQAPDGNVFGAVLTPVPMMRLWEITMPPQMMEVGQTDPINTNETSKWRTLWTTLLLATVLLSEPRKEATAG